MVAVSENITPTIGFFDSGIGGITVLSEAMQRMPMASFIYYADTAHVPYGEQKEADVFTYVQRAAEFLMQHNIDALVLACNTATSVSALSFRATYDIPIIGMEPAVKPALIQNDLHENERIIVTATDMTLRLKKLSDLIHLLQADARVDRLSLQKLVRFAEAGHFDTAEVESYLQAQFSSYDLDVVRAVVLGCTHFIFYKPIIRRILPKSISLMDGNVGTVSRLCSFFPTIPIKKSSTLSANRVRFYDGGQLMTGDRLAFYLALLKQAQCINEK